MTYKAGDDILITCKGKTVPGKIYIASENQVSLAVMWDVVATETMLAGHVGMMPLLRHSDGVYRTLIDHVEVKIEPRGAVQ